MKPPPNVWPTSESGRHGLYLAQSIAEMLNQRTYEGFRVQALDLTAKFDELLEVVNKVIKSQTGLEDLKQCLSELAASIGRDKAAQKILGRLGAEIETQGPTLVANDERKLTELYYLLDIANDKFRKLYKKNLESQILILCKFPAQKQDLRYSLQCYLSHLIYKDYDDRYIKSVAQEVFFTKDIKRFTKSKVERFFSYFSISENDYLVTKPASKATGKLCRVINAPGTSVREFDELPPLVRKFYQIKLQNPAKFLYIQSERKGVDPYAAADLSFKFLSFLASTSLLDTVGIEFSATIYFT